VELLLDEFGLVHFTEWARLGISVGTLALALAYAHLRPLRLFQPALTWLGQGFAKLNELFDWALEPFEALARRLWRGVRALAKRFGRRPTPPAA
jgi:hypothetical protein